jgi:PKD repeat protein
MKTKFFLSFSLLLFVFGTNAQLVVKNLGTSRTGYSNAYGTRQGLACYPAQNLVGWVHRSSPINNTIKMDVSMDGGNTWVVDKVTSWGVTPGGRLPKMAFFNPSGNTVPSNVWATAIVPIVSNTARNSYGTTVLSVATAGGTVLNIDTPLRSRQDTLRQIVSSVVSLSDRMLLLDKNGSIGVGNSDFTDTLTLTTLTPSSNRFNYFTQFLAVPMTAAPTLDEPGLPDVAMAFNESGSKGYIVALGHQSYTGADTGLTYLPIVMSSTDGGDNWTAPTQLSISALVRTALGVTWNPTCGWEVSATVDQSGNLHILTSVSRSLYSFDTLASGVANLAMVDIVTDGSTVLSVKKLGNPNSYRGLIGLSTSGQLTSDLRPCASRNLVGDKLFFNWFETQSTLSSTNNKPDWWMAAYDVASGVYTTARNMTAGTAMEGKIIFGSAANLVLSTVLPGGSTDYEIPVSYTALGASGSLADSVFHKYLQGGKINSSVFVAGVSISSSAGTNLCSGASTTLTSSSATGNRWHRNGSVISGATASTYVATQAGQYYTVVGPDTSNRITLVAVTSPSAPSVTPAGPLTLCAGTPLVLNTTWAAGTTVQWFRNGNLVSTVTNSGNFSADSAGTYTAKVEVNGCTSTASNAVVVNAGVKPSANFTLSDTVKCFIGNQFQINSTSSVSSGTLSLSWNFGQGGTSTSTNNSRTYTSAGTYVVKLVATSSTGCSDSISKTVRVIAQDSARFTVTGATTFCSGDSVRFSSSATSGIAWLRNNSAISGASSPIYFAKQSGSYRLVVTTNGCVDSSTATAVTVNALPATPTITRNAAQLTSSAASGNQWYLNGSPISGATGTTFTATQNGNYSVKVTNASGCSASSSSILVQLNTAPVVTISTALTFCQGGSVVLTSSATTGNVWHRNNTPISGATATTYSATQSGNYYTVVGADTSNRISVTVNAIPATPVISPAGPVNLCTNQSTNLSLSIPTGGSVAWSLNGSVLGSSSSTLTANSAGAYTAVITQNGCSSSVSNTVNVTINPYPSVGFTVNDTDQCLRGNQFIFTNSSTISSGTTTSTWTLNGSTSSTTNANATYTTSGTKTVKLVVSSAFGCADSISKSVVVYDQPVARFGLNTNSVCFRGHVLRVTDSASIATGTLNHFYDFSNGFTSTAIAPTYAFPAAGNYTIKQVVTSGFGCTDSTLRTVSVKPNFNISISAVGPTSFCDGDSVVLNATTQGANVAWYRTTTSVGTGTSYVAYLSGAYQAITTTNGCSDTSSTISVVNNPLPATPSISRNGNVLSTNATSGIQWYYNGNIIAGSTSSTININQNGLYYVVVTNAAGCSATSLTLQVTGVGIGENGIGALSLYPNPTADGIQVVLPETNRGGGEVTVTDLQGKVLHRMEVEKGVNRVYINLESLVSGMYLVIFQGEGQRMQGKVFKN